MWFLRVCHQVPHNRDDNLGLLSFVLFNSTSQSYVFKYDNTVSGDFKGFLCLLVAMSWMESASFAVEYYSVNIPVCMPVCASSPNPLLPLSSSSLALRIVFRPWPSRCSGFETVGILRCEDVSPTTNPQPEGPMCLSLHGITLEICPTWVALPAATLSVAWLSTFLVHARSHTRLNKGRFTHSMPFPCRAVPLRV
jgi:hypothetical protein